jgi:hypothetical protein
MCLRSLSASRRPGCSLDILPTSSPRAALGHAALWVLLLSNTTKRGTNERPRTKILADYMQPPLGKLPYVHRRPSLASSRQAGGS